MYIQSIGMDVEVKDEFRKVLVPLADAEKEMLRQNLESSGGIDPAIGKILIWQPDPSIRKAYIVEGHNRWEICNEMGYDYQKDDFHFANDFEDEDAAIRWIEDNQLGRRNISKYARFEIIYRRDGDRLRAEAEERQERTRFSSKTVSLREYSPVKEKETGAVKEILAKLVGVSPSTIVKYQKIYRSDREDVKLQLRMDQISIAEALRIIFPPEDTDTEIDPDEIKAPEFPHNKCKTSNQPTDSGSRVLLDKLHELQIENSKLKKQLKEMRAEKDRLDRLAEGLRGENAELMEIIPSEDKNTLQEKYRWKPLKELSIVDLVDMRIILEQIMWNSDCKQEFQAEENAVEVRAEAV